MPAVEGDLYLAGSAKRIPARLHLGPGRRLSVLALERTPEFREIGHDLEEVSISSALGTVPRMFEFPGNIRFECANAPEIESWLAEHELQQGSALLHAMERHWRWVVASLLLVFLTTIFTIQFGIPASAGWLADRVPARARLEVGRHTESLLEERFTAESSLEEHEQAWIRAGFERLVADVDTGGLEIRLHLRDGGWMGANAFAVPSGAVFLTDELVGMAPDSLAVLGVLAHELGHLAHRHGTERVIQAASLPMLFALLTGDLAGGGALLGTIPMDLIATGYGRDQEREADEFARDLLRELDMSTEGIAQLFELFAEEGLELPGWFSTHPASDERAAFFREG